MSGKFAVLSLLLASSVAWSQGDVLDMGVAKDRFEAPGKPTRGMSQDRVRSTFGEPQGESDFQSPRTFRFSVGFRF